MINDSTDICIAKPYFWLHFENNYDSINWSVPLLELAMYIDERNYIHFIITSS